MTKATNIPQNEVGPYKMFGFLGEGAFSIVRECKKEGSDEILACKVVPKTKMNTDKLMDRFEIEIRINQQLHHPGIVQMMDLLCDKANYYIIMEICKNGDLFQYIGDKGKLKENDAKPVFKQILETMSYLHHMGVAHRDMKPENILIDSDGRVKIADFGLAKFVDQQYLVTTPCGSANYTSPECLSSRGKPYNGFSNDAWGCGVILFQMLTGTLPWTKKAQAQLFAQIMKGEYSIPGSVGKDAKNLIKSLMTVDCNKRMSIDDALKHKWFKDMNPMYDLSRAKGYVSLRQVDIYFGKEIKDLKLTDEIEVTNSVVEFQLDSVLTLLGVDPSTHSKRRHHRKNSDEGHSRHRHHRRSECAKKSDKRAPLDSSTQSKENANDVSSSKEGEISTEKLAAETVVSENNGNSTDNNSINVDTTNNTNEGALKPPLSPTGIKHKRKKTVPGGTVKVAAKNSARARRKKNNFQTHVVPKSATHVSEEVKSYQTIVQHSSDEEGSSNEEEDAQRE